MLQNSFLTKDAVKLAEAAETLDRPTSLKVLDFSPGDGEAY